MDKSRKSEAWWAELQELNGKVNNLEKRLVELHLDKRVEDGV